MKALGIILAGVLAAAGGVAAAAYIAKKKLEKENEDDYFDAWDDEDNEDWDFDFDEEIEDNGLDDKEIEDSEVDDAEDSVDGEKITRIGSVFTEEPADDTSDGEL